MSKKIGYTFVGRKARILKPEWLWRNPIRLLGGECNRRTKNAESDFFHRKVSGVL